MQGVSLTLSKIGSSTITVQRDTTGVEAAANAFVATYNALLGNATVLTRYDAKKQTGAPLMGDSTLRAVQTAQGLQFARPGQTIVIAAGMPFGTSKDTNMILVETL